MADAFAAVLLIILTLFVPPLGVFFIGGCCPDLFINVCLTLLGYFPGHIHAFYCEYVYYDRRSRGHQGRIATSRAPGIFSSRIQNGGDMTTDYYYPPPPGPQTVQMPPTAAPAPVAGYAGDYEGQQTGYTRPV
ncbi:hypothetical protein FQN55_001596 [Onygenales sp. PD_40]|nr:hypothetical protein FQN55_001596 [Onygenales sp. PD_40]KAK2807151.1 hypothetical protein FQN51_004765 [Onygenales sp. PD_10]